MNVINDTGTSLIMNREEIEEEMGPAENWEDTPASIKAYIDDLNLIEKIRHSDAVTHTTQKKNKKYLPMPLRRKISSKEFKLAQQK